MSELFKCLCFNNKQTRLTSVSSFIATSGTLQHTRVFYGGDTGHTHTHTNTDNIACTQMHTFVHYDYLHTHPGRTKPSRPLTHSLSLSYIYIYIHPAWPL